MLTDVVMPGMNGRDLATRVAADYPHVRVLFTSGYRDDEILRYDVLDHAAHFSGKPYTIDTLTSRVQELLAASPEQPVA
jgi:two-component system, cell cycle sensor histidine kinase and response regulator CckA